MSIEFLVAELKELSYAVVTLKIKNADKDSYCEVTGLFMGMQPLVPNNTALVSKNEIYIWLSKGEECCMLSTKYYDVDQILIGKGNTKYTFPGKPTDTDEHESRLMIMYQAMKVADKLKPNGLIDISRYKDVPIDIQSLISENKDLSRKSTGTPLNSPPGAAGNNNKSGFRNSAACGYTAPSYKKKETETKAIKRTTRYSPSAAIERMRDKILKIQAGTYTAPKLKTMGADKNKEKGAAAKQASPPTGAISDPYDCEGYTYGLSGY